MKRKRYEGIFGKNTFTLFTVEKPEETWFKWKEQECEPLGTVTIKGVVTDHYNSSVRPGYYEIKNAEIINKKEEIKIDNSIPIKRVVTFSIPFIQQAFKGEKIKACGLLELVTPKEGKRYYRIVVGYFDAYINDRREKEFIKAVI